MADATNPMGRPAIRSTTLHPLRCFSPAKRRVDAGNTLFVDGGSHINGVAWAPDLDAG